MEYKKYEREAFNVYTIKTDKFKNCHIEIMFYNTIKKEDITKRSFLFDMLMDSSLKYPCHKDLVIEYENLYNATLYSVNSKIGKTITTNVCLDFLNPVYTEEIMLEKSISLLFEVLKKPNIKNNEFCNRSFDIVKNRLKLEIASIKENPKKYSVNKMLYNMDPESTISYNVSGYLEDLEKITPSNLFDYYKKIIKEDLFDIYIIGDLNMDTVVNIIDKNCSFKTIKNLDLEFFENPKTVKKPNVVVEHQPLNQASLVLGYNLIDLNQHQINYVMPIYNFILGGGSLDTKLYKLLREKNSLCYNVNSIYQKYAKIMMIITGIDKKNYNKSLSLINKCVKEMQLGKFGEIEIENAKKFILSSLNIVYDNPSNIIDLLIFKNLVNLEDVEIRKEKFQKITKDEIIEVAKKVKLNTTYLLCEE